MVDRAAAHPPRIAVRALVVALAVLLVTSTTARPHRAVAAGTVTPNSTVAKWITGITQSSLAPLVNEYSGETPTVVGGRSLTLTTRAEASGEMIDLAEQWVYEHLASYGLSSVSYAPYPGRGTVSPGRNVIGEIRGSITPNDVVIISCHIDDRPFFRTSTVAYGADDGAGGCAAVLRIAQAFAGHRFASTIRFAASSNPARGQTTFTVVTGGNAGDALIAPSIRNVSPRIDFNERITG